MSLRRMHGGALAGRPLRCHFSRRVCRRGRYVLFVFSCSCPQCGRRAIVRHPAFVELRFSNTLFLFVGACRPACLSVCLQIAAATALATDLLREPVALCERIVALGGLPPDPPASAARARKLQREKEKERAAELQRAGKGRTAAELVLECVCRAFLLFLLCVLCWILGFLVRFSPLFARYVSSLSFPLSAVAR
jgi:hypothetical protein